MKKQENHISEHIIKWRMEILGQKEEDFEFILKDEKMEKVKLQKEKNNFFYEKTYKILRAYNIGLSQGKEESKVFIKSKGKGKYFLN